MKLRCALIGHRYFVEKELTQYSRKLGCRNCRKKFAMNDDVESLLNWDDDFDRLYKDHGVL